MKRIHELEDELEERVTYFKENDKLLEAQRIRAAYQCMIWKCCRKSVFVRASKTIPAYLARQKSGQRSVYFVGLLSRMII